MQQRLVDAAKAYKKSIRPSGKKMLISLAGAMSTAELGKILAEMIRQGQVDIISCTGANLEEDVMNLVAHDHYERVPNYRDLTPTQQERDLLDRGMNRVTDTCIPEHEAFRRMEKHVVDLWTAGRPKSGNRRFPHQYFYEMINSGVLEAVLPDRPQRQLDGGRRRAQPAHHLSRLGRQHLGQHLRRATAWWATCKPA
jgi:deoxyhypusine synthase